MSVWYPFEWEDVLYQPARVTSTCLQGTQMRPGQLFCRFRFSRHSFVSTCERLGTTRNRIQLITELMSSVEQIKQLAQKKHSSIVFSPKKS